MGEFGNKRVEIEYWSKFIHISSPPSPPHTSGTSKPNLTGESVFLVNKPQAHNGAAHSRESERKKGAQ